MDIYHIDSDVLKMESILLSDDTNNKMVSSTTSSLTSPGDSGVQLLDSESDITSVMSASGYELDRDPMTQSADCEKLNEMFDDLISKEKHVMTKSDIVNQNCGHMPDGSEVKIEEMKPEDIMNVSLNSYELLDYTAANKSIKDPPEDQMHVSMSEEVNESLQIVKSENSEVPPIEPNVNEVKPAVDQTPDDQIVFRRQRKKKSKTDTPKKRVSFHEDILNSTKIDDIHINHGFVTIEPDVSTNFFLRGFSKKPDVVKGRYSWAAEGDAPFYDKNKSDREVKSEIYIHTARFSSVSSSSSGSTSSSIDEEDKEEDDEDCTKKPSLTKMPKSSCLKKTKPRKMLNTNIVEEESSIRKRKNDTNLLDTKIFGSLKNILNFSTSVPLAERGVPEGQEDVAVYSTSHEEIPKKSPLELMKNNLKLSISDGCQPNKFENSNVLICDSNVYEHKGISYSYEYDTFQKSFINQKPKSSTVYQMILKEFNFFKRKAKEPTTPQQPEDEFVILNATTPAREPSFEIKEEGIEKYAINTKIEWSDSDTISDTPSSRHLHSPKKKINKANHYALQNFSKSDSLSDCEASTSKSLPTTLRSSSSKNSLINRFLRNVTLKKLLDSKLQRKLKLSRKYMGLYIPGVKPNRDASRIVNSEIEKEILEFKKDMVTWQSCINQKIVTKLQNQIFRSNSEVLSGMFPVWSAYTTSGEHKPLMVVLTNATLYIVGIKQNSIFCNHFVLPYTELNTLLIGPNAQTVHISNYDNDMQCLITTGCGVVTNNLVIHLEMSMRRDKNRPMLPAIKQLNMQDMGNLRRTICKQTPVEKDEQYFYYSVINLQEYISDNLETPLGPNKEGPLMFKISDTESRWETAYFILKAGVLYMLSSPSHRVPMRVLPLINGACQGARRVFNCPRPHTFQLIVSGNTYHLAAPDEYVASEWLQALVHAASGTYSHKERMIAQQNTLLMTTQHILMVREAFPCNFVDSKSNHDPIRGAQTLSCASISDIVSFRLPSAEQSWCILEFACREAQETSGDWILYFASNSELENFISTLEMLWAYHNEGESFPLSMLSDTDALSRKCSETYNVMQNYRFALQPRL